MPTVPVTSLLPRRARPLPAPIGDEEVSFWFSARIALWQAAQALGLKAGDSIAVPAFCCGSEVEPFEHLGLKPRFFRVSAGLDPDPESFSQAVREADAALVTHYFGFPAALEHARSECDARGIPLIEDCAHALYSATSDGPVGRVGDASVFSFRKTVALPDGAALRVRNAKVPVPSQREAAPSDLVQQRLRRLIGHGLHSSNSSTLRISLQLALSTKHWLERRPPADEQGAQDGAEEEFYEDMRFKPERVRVGMSSRSDRMFRASDHAAIALRRRMNYTRLMPVVAEHASLQPLFAQLPEGGCPLFLPILVREHESLCAHMERENIGVKHIWPWMLPSVPWDKFPHEVELKRTVLGLPIHQCLREDDLARIASALAEWNGE